MRKIRSYRTLKKVKIGWIVICQDLRNKRQQINEINVCGRIFDCIAEWSRTRCV